MAEHPAGRGKPTGRSRQFNVAGSAPGQRYGWGVASSGTLGVDRHVEVDELVVAVRGQGVGFDAFADSRPPDLERDFVRSQWSVTIQ